MSLMKTVTVVMLMLALASCANTIRGIGRDINETADAIGDAVGG